MNILVNLPETFHTAPILADRWAKLATLGEVRHTSHNSQEDILPDLKWADAVLMWTWPVLDDAMLGQTRLKYLGAINTARPTARTCLAPASPFRKPAIAGRPRSRKWRWA